MKIVITGATGGLGGALARLYGQQNAHLLLTGRDPHPLERLQKELSCKVEIIVADLAYERREVVEWIRREKPDLLINSAGFGLYGEAKSLSLIKQFEMMRLSEALLELSLAQLQHQGWVCNISSVLGDLIAPYVAVYAASKAFVTQLSLALDLEAKKSGGRVLLSKPGQIETAFAERAGGKAGSKVGRMHPDYVAKRIAKQIEQGKGVEVIDFRYKIVLLVAKLFPKLIAKRIGKAILDRLS